MTAGQGISAVIDGCRYDLGSEKYMVQALGTPYDSFPASVREIMAGLHRQGKASVFAAKEKKLLGVIALSDTLRPEAASVIRELASLGTKAVLLTGDHPEAARYFASQAGITEVHADLMPEEKVREVSALAARGGVCMIGDGVNDAPALKLADVGAAMGAMGSDIAVEAADIALMTDDLTKVPYLKWLGRATVRTIRGAITLSMCINFIAIILSVLGVLTPTTGALVHNCGSCFVVLLAALLYDRKYVPSSGIHSSEKQPQSQYPAAA